MGTLIEAPPAANATAEEEYPPLVSVTDPVGVRLPLPPLTVMLTPKACALLMLDAEGPQ